MPKFILMLIPCLLMGCRTGPDFDEMKVKAEKGDANAQNYLGTAYQHGEGLKQDIHEAIKWYRKAADQGEVYAQNNLGYIYDYGEGVKTDYKKAVKWYQKAADQGLDQGQFYLGLMYYEAKGVTQNFKEAEKWFQKSAGQGDSSAQGLLRDMYWRGKGVKQDRVAAYAWAKIVCENDGRSHAEEHKNDLKKEMSKTQIFKTEKLFREMISKNPKLIQKNN